MFKFISSLASTSGIVGSQISAGGKTVTVQEKIAQGGYGSIYKCSDTYGKQYALKVLMSPDSEHYESIKNEYEVQKQLSGHKNIVEAYSMTTDSSNRQALILMEFCNGSCVDLMNQRFNQGFDSDLIYEIFTSVVKAIIHMHQQDPPIIHRDLKVENILSVGGIWKLCDFGSATTRVYLLDTQSDRNAAADDIQKNTTAPYRSPEMCDLYRRQKIDSKSDVWALGCVLYKLCTFKDAFGEGSNLQILNVKYSWPKDRQIDERFKEVVSYCFNTDPAKRPTAEDVLDFISEKFGKHRKVHRKAQKVEEAPIEKIVTVQSSPNIFESTDSMGISQKAEPIRNFVAQPITNSRQLFEFENVVDTRKIETKPINFEMQNSLFEAPTITSTQKKDYSKITTNPLELAHDLIKQEIYTLNSSLLDINSQYPHLYVSFALTLILNSGSKITEIIGCIPRLSNVNFNHLLDRHSEFANEFPQFEGNFSLHSFMVANRAAPPPVGQAPVSGEAVRGLLAIIEYGIPLLRTLRSKECADYIISAYQATSYILAKLKVFSVSLGYINGNAIPLLKSFHSQILKIVECAETQIQFPKSPFNFDDADFLKRIRPPASRTQ